MMARRIAYGVVSALAALSVIGAALGQGMTTFATEQKAQQHCPADTVVWLNTSSALYHLKGEPWYGRTQRGAYVCKAEADKNGERPYTATNRQ
jgi:hypothetical protein